MNVFTVFVIGLGSIGLRHARNIKDLGHRVLGFDPDTDKCTQFSRDTGFETVSRDTGFESSDAVVVGSPNRFHLSDLECAIAFGKPVFVEKPLGHNPQIASDLIQNADEKKLLVSVGQNLRFRTVVQRTRELIEENEIGDPIWASFVCSSWLPDWRPGQDYRKNYAADPETGGVIFDSIHEFDLAVHLLGPATMSAASAGRSGLLEMESEDIADILLLHESGCRTHIHLDYVTRSRRRHLTIAGTKGIVTADLRSGKLELIRPDAASPISEYHSFDANTEYVSEIKNFLAAVNGNESPACSAREALDILAIACKARNFAGLPSAEISQEQAKPNS